jgi:hypothetical protein
VRFGVTPLYVAVIVALTDADTAFVETVNVALEEPAPIVTFAGTLDA